MGTCPPFRARDGVPINFILYSSTTTHSLAKDLGGPEYSYFFVARGFAPALERLGKVHSAVDPVNDVDRIHDECVARGEDCLFLYCAPPHRMMQGTRCPTIPVIAWEFSDIPTETWDEDPRNDWRYVLAKTVGAITLSRFAAASVRKAMGPDYPVLAAPAAVWDRSPTKGQVPVREVVPSAPIEFDGFAFDSRGTQFAMGVSPPPAPHRAPGEAKHMERVTLDGVVFTSVFAPKDGRKNWQDMLTAFLAAFRDSPDATLVFKMIGRESYWWWELHDLMARMPAAQCRVVVIQGYLDDASFGELMAATHWIVNSSVAEGLCLPLLEFMCAGRPAVAPAHTAMADYLSAANAMIVQSGQDYCGWPQDKRCNFTTMRYRIEWSSLRDALSAAYRITKNDASRYAAMADAAFATMRDYCAEQVVARRIAVFLGVRAA
jgi:glycosyltransferase involved in cell wall biosynthesis